MTDASATLSVTFGPGAGDKAGARFLLAAAPAREALAPGMPAAFAAALPPLRAGQLLKAAGEEHRLLGRQWWPSAVPGSPDVPCWLVETITAGAGQGERSLELSRSGFALAWITLSDKGAAGLRADASGPLIEELARAEMPVAFARGFVLPDEERQIAALLSQLALVDGFDLICTTGGTGVAPRDVTPEATQRVIEKRLPGFERAMTITSLAKTPRGAVSRAVCGTLGTSVILNLPGSPKAVRECLGAVLPALAHTIEKLQGDPSDCATS